MTRAVFALVATLALAPIPSSAQTSGDAPVTTTSKEALVLYQKAVDHLENIEIAKAAPLLDQAIQKDPAFAMAYLMRAQAGGGFNVSRQNLDKAVSLAPKASPAERHWIMALQAQFNSDTPAAKQHIAELLKLTPNDKHAIAFAGNFYRGLGDDEQALKYYERAVSVDPTFAAAYNQVGYTHMRLGNAAGAEAAFKKYIANRAESPNPFDSYAEMLLDGGRYDESIAQYNAALAKDPTFPGSFTGIGHNQVFKGEYDKARASYKRLHDLGSPSNKMAGLFWTAVSYVHEGNTSEALKTFDQQREVAVKEGLIPTVAGTHFNQAFVLAESGKIEESRKHLAEATKVIEGAQLPDSVKANLRRQVEFGAALNATSTKDSAAARAHLDKVKAMITPGLPPAVMQQYEFAVGMNEFSQGNYEAAIAHFNKADDQDPYTTFYVAEATRLKGDAAGAEAMYKKVLASNQNGLGYAVIRSRAKKAVGSGT